jgi:hypothetical protein
MAQQLHATVCQPASPGPAVPIAMLFRSLLLPEATKPGPSADLQVIPSRQMESLQTDSQSFPHGLQDPALLDVLGVMLPMMGPRADGATAPGSQVRMPRSVESGRRRDWADQSQMASTDMMLNPPAASSHFCQLSPGSSNSVRMMSRVAMYRNVPAPRELKIASNSC